MPSEQPKLNAELLLSKDYAQQIARGLALAPEALPDFIAEVQTLSTLSLTADATIKTGQIDVFTRNVAREINNSVDWGGLESHTFTEETAGILLTTLSKSRSPLTKTTRKLDQHVLQITQELFSGYLTTRFQQSHNWKGALSAFNTVTEAAFRDPNDLARAETWFDIATDKFNNIPVKNTIVYTAMFLSVRNASPESEEYLDMYVNISNTMAYMSRLFRREKDFKDAMSYPNAWYHVIEHATDPDNLPTGYEDCREIVEAKLRHPLRYRALSLFFTDGGKSPEKRSIPIEDGITFPYSVIAKYRHAERTAENMFFRVSGKAALREHAENFAHEICPNPRILEFNTPDLAGYIIIPEQDASEILTPQDAMAFAQQKLNKYDVASRLAEKLKEIRIGTSHSVSLEEGNIAFLVTRAECAPSTPLQSALDLQIPTPLRADAFANLKDILALRTKIARDFNRTVTRAGVEFGFSSDDSLPEIFSKARLQLVSPGKFSCKLSVHVPERWDDDTALEIASAITLTDGQVRVSLLNADNFPPDLEWFIEKTILRLIEAQCCIPHSELETVQAHELLEGESHPLLTDRVGSIVHIGVSTRKGEPGRPSIDALKQHALEVYALSLDGMDLKEAVEAVHAISGFTLFELNELHQALHSCKKNITWRRSHESEAPPGNPIRVSVPKNIFDVTLYEYR